MNESTAALAEGLVKAIQAERDAYSFYRMAAGSTDDPKGKEMFGMLSEEEAGHAFYLEAQYRSILKSGKPDPKAALGAKADLSEQTVFSEEIRSRLKEAQYEMSALSIGIQLELSAIKYYRAQSEAAADPAVGKFFSELAAWESGHYHLLLRQQVALKEDYWRAAGFSPLY
jgi:rubrerythrin